MIVSPQVGINLPQPPSDPKQVQDYLRRLNVVIDAMWRSLQASAAAGAGAGDMTKAVYDADLDGVVDSAEAAPWAGITGKPATYPPDVHGHGTHTGLSNDDHTQYLNTTRHDTTTRHTLGTVVPHDSHSALSNLLVDTHTQYVLLAGRSGGQTIVGGSAASNNLTLQSTSSATRGAILTNDVLKLGAVSGRRLEIDAANLYDIWEVGVSNPHRIGIAHGSYASPVTDDTPRPTITAQKFTSATKSTGWTEIPYLFQSIVQGGTVASIYNLVGYACANGTRTPTNGWLHYDLVGVAGIGVVNAGFNGAPRGGYFEGGLLSAQQYAYAVGIELVAINGSGTALSEPTGNAYQTTTGIAVEGSAYGVGSQYNTYGMTITGGLDRNNSFRRGIYFGGHVIAPSGYAIDMKDIGDSDYVPIRFQNNTSLYWRNAADGADIQSVYVSSGDNLCLRAVDTNHSILGICGSTQVSSCNIYAARFSVPFLGIGTSYTPTGTADAQGVTGDIAWSDTYIYLKTSVGWKRAAISTF